MRPRSTQIFKTDASYDEITQTPQFAQLAELVHTTGAVCFIYRGCSSDAMVVFKNAAHIEHHVCPATVRCDTDPELVYAMVYSI